VKQAAKFIGTAPTSRIYDLVAQRKLTPRRDGRRLLFAQADLRAYVECG
jgi:Helix-turn-helix domain